MYQQYKIIASVYRPVLPGLLAFALCLSQSAYADTTTLTLANTSQNSSTSAAVTMQFPFTRSGDLSYDTVLNYHTIDGTAHAGTHYGAASGSIILPAGLSSTTIPVTINTQSGSGASGLAFQLQVDGAGGVGPAPSFAAQQGIAVGAVDAITSADVNGDGKPDLIMANTYGNSISVLLDTTAPGASTPSFGNPQTFAVGVNPAFVAAIDVNGDGKLDLIVANGNDNTVSVLLNTTTPGAATPSFAAQQTFATGMDPESVAAIDVNGDGKPDLIVANSSDSTVSVLLNITAPGAATPSFAAQQTFATGSSPQSLAIADVNGDGKPDVIVGNYGGNTVSVLLNTTVTGTSTPSFAAQQTFATASGPFSVSAADINGDGKPDLMVANFSSNSVSVLLNTTVPGSTTPSFAAQQAFGTGAGPVSVTAVDVNGDGKSDLIVANRNSNTVSVLRNTTVPGAPTPSFAAQQTFATGTNPRSVIATDVNGDGKPDLILTSIIDGNIAILLNTSATPGTTASFSTQQTFATGTSASSVASADINGDGKPDLIVIGSTNSVSVLLDTTAPSAATPTFATRQSFATGESAISVTAADLNGDGKSDLIVANYNDNTVSVLFNTTVPGASTPSFATQQIFATGLSPMSVTTADVNGDGKPDLIVVNSGDVVVGNQDTFSVSVLLNTTASGAAIPSFAAQQSFATGNVPYFVRVVDINGDGRPDLLVANVADGNVSVMLNTTAPGATTPSFATQHTFAAGSTTYSLTTTDINGDGKPDLIVVNSGGVSILLNTTAPGATIPSFATQQPFATGSNGGFVTTADVDGDGKTDLILVNSNGATVSLLLNTTPPGATIASFATRQTFATGRGTNSVVATDLNGDGKPDLIVSNAMDNTVSVLLNTQYLAKPIGSPATGTIVNDHIFANGFE